MYTINPNSWGGQEAPADPLPPYRASTQELAKWDMDGDPWESHAAHFVETVDRQVAELAQAVGTLAVGSAEEQ